MVEYQDFLYSDYPHRETHPDRLATIAILGGLSPADPERCRVLELGCGLGGNLIGLATALPGSHFVGIDRSAAQIAVGEKTRVALELENLELRAQDILDFAAAAEPGEFDYILCHGIYSWVPATVQAAILAIMRRCLAPHGVGYVSYNTLPGWHMRSMLRELLRRHAGDGSHQERITRARALLAVLAQTPSERSAAHAFLGSEVQLLGQLPDEYLYYEHLVDDNQPLYLRQFVDAAEAAGLAYLGDSHQPISLQRQVGAEALCDRHSDDILEQEQLLDYVDVRFFRRTLLCQQERQLIRDPGPAELERLRVNSALVPQAAQATLDSDEPESFRGPGDRGIEAHEPLLKAALWLLAERSPLPAWFPELAAAAFSGISNQPWAQAPVEAQRQLGQDLLSLVARGFLHLSRSAPHHVSQPGPYPETTPLARLQASRPQGGCTNLRHESVEVEEFDRALLLRLDGSRSIDDIVSELLADIAADRYDIRRRPDEPPVTDRDELREIVEQQLRRLAHTAFLRR